MRRSAGHVREKTPGRWHWYATVPDPSRSTGRRQLSKGPFPSQREAERALRAALVARDGHALATAPASLTFGAWLDQWLSDIAPLRRSSTMETHRSMARAHVQGTPLAAMALRDVNRSALGSWLAGVRAKTKRTGESLSEGTVHGAWRTVRAALHAAVEAELIMVAPRPPRSTRSTAGEGRARVEPWSDDELARWLTEVDQRGDAGLGLRLAVSTGLRRGEISGLRWSDVDFAAGSLTVARTITSAIGGPQVGAPKTANSRRTVVLDADTVTRLRAHRQAQREHALANGLPWSASLPIVARPDLEPWTPDHLTRIQRESCDAAGVPRRTVHDLRHLAARDLIKAGVPLTTASRLLGHSSVAITGDRYGHLEADPDALAILAAYRAARRPGKASGR